MASASPETQDLDGAQRAYLGARLSSDAGSSVRELIRSDLAANKAERFEISCDEYCFMQTRRGSDPIVEIRDGTSWFTLAGSWLYDPRVAIEESDAREFDFTEGFHRRIKVLVAPRSSIVVSLLVLDARLLAPSDVLIDVDSLPDRREFRRGRARTGIPNSRVVDAADGLTALQRSNLRESLRRIPAQSAVAMIGVGAAIGAHFAFGLPISIGIAIAGLSIFGLSMDLLNAVLIARRRKSPRQ